MILLTYEKNDYLNHLVSDFGKSETIHTIPLGAGDTEVKDLLEKELNNSEDTTIINCCQISNIPFCEYNRETAYSVHSSLAKQIAEFCKEQNKLMVSFGTSYIFDGKKEEPYTEEDAPNPQSAYADSMLLGERNIQDSGCRHLVIRISHAYGRNVSILQNIANISKQERTIDFIREQILSPTCLFDISQGISSLIENNSEGIFNIANSGTAATGDFIEYILSWQKENRNDTKAYSTREADFDDYRFPVDMPVNSALDITKYSETVGQTPRAWHDALKDFLENHPEILIT